MRNWKSMRKKGKRFGATNRSYQMIKTNNKVMNQELHIIFVEFKKDYDPITKLIKLMEITFLSFTS